MKDFLPLLKQLIKKSNVFYASYRYYIFAFSLFLFIAGLFLLNNLFLYEVQVLRPLPEPFVVKVAEYPMIERKYLPGISAESAYVLDNTSKVALFTKNENLRFAPASTTKIMTALTGLDYYQPNDMLTITRANVEPVVIGFPKGVKVTFVNLLYGMFLPSGNDAALAVGDNYPGGMQAFIAKMNEKAQALHLTNTHYADPVGLLDSEDYTTAHDLAFLASDAIMHPLLAQIVNTKTKVITDSAGNVYSLQNINKLLGQYGVNGLKTGYTEEAGQVLVTSANIQGHIFLLVVMKSQDRFGDTEKLLQLISQNVTYLSIHP